jgi:hypothetical protein
MMRPLLGHTPDVMCEEYMRLEEGGNTMVVRQCCLHVSMWVRVHAWCGQQHGSGSLRNPPVLCFRRQAPDCVVDSSLLLSPFMTPRAGVLPCPLVAQIPSGKTAVQVRRARCWWVAGLQQCLPRHPTPTPNCLLCAAARACVCVCVCSTL